MIERKKDHNESLSLKIHNESERETGFGPATSCLEGRRSTGLSYSRVQFLTTLVCPLAVAVRTNDIALRDFLEDEFAAALDHSRDNELLGVAIAVIELHHV